jgi:hypothetical protein
MCFGPGAGAAGKQQAGDVKRTRGGEGGKTNIFLRTKIPLFHKLLVQEKRDSQSCQMDKECSVS